MQKNPQMLYRYLGPTGIKVSVISYGNWLNSNSQQAKQLTIDCVKAAWDLGINFFDTAEVYGYGEAERQIGVALKALKVPRHQFVLSTKLFFGQKAGYPNRKGLSRKHIVEGMKNSLKKLDFPYVDVVFCHRYDCDTPLEEVCRAFDWLIRKGYAFYWGTSEWTSEQFQQALMVCQKYGLVKPTVQQPQYNLFVRDKLEADYRRLFQQKKLGTTVWSPLLGGLLTGKYNDGTVPEKSRVDSTQFKYDQYLVKEREQTLKKLQQLKKIADELGCSMAQLAMAWVIHNPNVSTAITGATKTQQLVDTVRALDVLSKFNRELQDRIEAIFKTSPVTKLSRYNYQLLPSSRREALGYV